MVKKFLVLGTFDVLTFEQIEFLNQIFKIARVRERKGHVDIAITSDKIARSLKNKLVFCEKERKNYLEQIPLINSIIVADLKTGLEGMGKYDYVCIGGGSSYDAKVNLHVISKKIGFTPLYFSGTSEQRKIPEVLVEGIEYFKKFKKDKDKDGERGNSSSILKSKYQNNKKVLEKMTEETLKIAIQISEELFYYLKYKIENNKDLTKRERIWEKHISQIINSYKKIGIVYQPVIRHDHIEISDSLKGLKEFYYS